MAIDHGGPAVPDPSDLSPDGIASISRSLSMNDPQYVYAGRIGTVYDRNTELLLVDPLVKKKR